MTQAQLAARAGLSTETIRKYETGFRSPNRDRLIALLDAMRVPSSRSAAVLTAAGYAPRKARPRRTDRVPEQGDLDQVLASIETSPWPRLVVDEMLCVMAVNAAMAALLGLEPGFQNHRTRAQLSLVTMLAEPRVAQRLANFDDCLSQAAARLKSCLAHHLTTDDAAAFADEVLVECSTQGPASTRRVMRIWEATPAKRHGSGASYTVLWNGQDGARIRFLAAVTEVAGPHGPACHDWHPADAASHANLETVLSTSSLRGDRESARPIGHSIPT
jgi:transcriptional regulator with XRE-family HTH domain